MAAGGILLYWENSPDGGKKHENVAHLGNDFDGHLTAGMFNANRLWT